MSGEHILIIDDSKEMVTHLKEDVLPRFGYQTSHAYDGISGLKKIREINPDLIMLDYNLPEMTGIDVLQQLVQESIETPVVLMTGYGSELRAIKAFRLGAKDYLIKPFTIDEVLETIDRALVEKRLQHDKEVLAEQTRRLKVEMSRQTNEMNTLFNIGKAITSLLSVDQVLGRVLEAASHLASAEQSMIWMPNQKDDGVIAYEKRGREAMQFLKPDVSLIESPVGQVLRTGRPLRQSIFSGRGIKIKTDFFARAVLYVPLKLRGATIGVLSVSNQETLRSFSKRDEFLLAFLADYAAIALENARTFQETDSALGYRLEELNTLIEITRTITSSLSIDEVVQMTIQQVHNAWNIEASSIWLLDKHKQTLRVLANVGTPIEVLGQFDVPLGKGFVGEVAQHGRPLYTNNVPAHELHYRQVDQETGFHTRTLLCVPLMFGGEIIGALQLLNKIDGDFDEPDVERAVSIAAAVAIAVTNALIFDESEQQQARLYELDRAKDEFVTAVSHDMRAPLNTLTGYLDLLPQVGPLNQTQTHYVTRMTEAVDYMMDLVNDLLELAKVDTDNHPEMENCELPGLVREVIYDLQGLALRKSVAVELEIEDELPPVLGNQTQLRRAITNLVDNALKYSPEGAVVQVTLASEQTAVVLGVRDHGPGISQDDLPYIFDKFYRGSNIRHFSGTGLGLALVSSIAATHHGEVGVDTSDTGSYFYLKLPVSHLSA